MYRFHISVGAATITFALCFPARCEIVKSSYWMAITQRANFPDGCCGVFSKLFNATWSVNTSLWWVPVEVWPKVFNRPPTPQTFQPRNAIVLFMSLQGSTGIGNGTKSAIRGPFCEDCSQPSPKGIRLQPEWLREVWISEDW